MTKCRVDELEGDQLLHAFYAAWGERVMPSLEDLLEREHISIWSMNYGWEAAAAVDNWAGPLVGDWKTPAIKGRTAKEAVLRCYVASRFGEEVDLP